MENSSPKEAPKKIGRYEVLRLLGKGGMSKVYQVRVPILNKIAALKVFEPGPHLVRAMGLELLRRQFITEAAIIANLRHPHILDVWSLEEEGQALFYLMEFYCHNLGTIIGETYWVDAPSRIIPVEKTVQYIGETLAGVARLHHAGIVHRDIKPFNIMITDQDTVKIADFGLSKRRGELSRPSGSMTGTLSSPTGGGKAEPSSPGLPAPIPPEIFIGTKLYAAPEQETDPEAVDAATDLYSVGVMCYRLLTGRLPVHPVIPASKWNPILNSDWDDFLLKAVSLFPTDRFPSATDMAHRLQELDSEFRETRAHHCRLLRDDPMKNSPPSPGGGPFSAPTSLTEQREGSEFPKPLRSKPATITHQQARDFFQLDELWRPGKPISRLPEGSVSAEATTGRLTIMDTRTRLVWQQSGSPYPLNREDADRYVDRLNQETFDGRSDWRMPTVDELLSILRPDDTGNDFCAAPVFNPLQKWIWSADRRSRRAAWYVNMEMGFVAAFDISGFFHVRAVRDLDASPL
ncbi:MAG: serine/threonine protein kinase [Thermodesulfobacteriota bacterium]